MNSKFEEKSTTKFDPAERSISIRRRWRSSQRPVPAVSHGPCSACRCTRHTLHCCVRASLEREKNEKKKKKSGPFWELLKHILVVSSVALKKKMRRKLLFLILEIFEYFFSRIFQLFHRSFTASSSPRLIIFI